MTRTHPYLRPHRSVWAALAVIAVLLSTVIGSATPSSADDGLPEPVTAAVGGDLSTTVEALSTQLSSVLPNAFGGAWLDGESVVVGLRSVGLLNLAPLVDGAARTLGLDVTVQRVDRSLRQLVDVQSTVQAAVEDGVSGIHAVFVDPTTNQVVVQASEGRIGAVQSLLGSVAGVTGLVRVEAGSPASLMGCSDVRCGAPLRGGVEITGPTTTCSSGFNIKNSHGYFMLTAGHCVRGQIGQNWNVSVPDLLESLLEGSRLGPVAAATFSGTGDFGAIRVSDPVRWDPQGIVRSSANPALPVRGAGNPVVGLGICRYGRSTNTVCGTVTAINVSVNYGADGWVHGLASTTADSCQGDSGGAFRGSSNGFAYGLLSGGTVNYRQGNLTCGFNSYFQPVGEALAAYGATILVS